MAALHWTLSYSEITPKKTGNGYVQKGRKPAQTVLCCISVDQANARTRKAHCFTRMLIRTQTKSRLNPVTVV